MAVVKLLSIKADSKRDRRNVLSHSHCSLRDVAGNRLFQATLSMQYPVRVDVEKLRLTFIRCLKLPQVEGMINCVQAEKK